MLQAVLSTVSRMSFARPITPLYTEEVDMSAATTVGLWFGANLKPQMI
jgi:hypothetical protein